VPGTIEHTAGATYLVAALQEAGFAARQQNFSGETYEALMQSKQNSAAYPYFSNSFYCDVPERARLRTLDFSNIVATGGNVGASNLFLFMAHWDSKRFAEGSKEPVLGANDGAAGVGVLLELARVVAKRDTSWEIRILFTDGEDGFEDCHPLAGSMYYADRMSTAERERLRPPRHDRRRRRNVLQGLRQRHGSREPPVGGSGPSRCAPIQGRRRLRRGR
jgi:hypothetical protein